MHCSRCVGFTSTEDRAASRRVSLAIYRNRRSSGAKVNAGRPAVANPAKFLESHVLASVRDADSVRVDFVNPTASAVLPRPFAA
jgi:hypothetical protein